MIEAEAAQANTTLMSRLDELDPLIARRLAYGAAITASALSSARSVGLRFKETLMAILDRHALIALPVMSDIPLPLTEGRKAQFPYHSPVNLAGLPALTMPVSREALSLRAFN